MKTPTSRPRPQLRLNLQPPLPAAPRSTALVRALADLLLGSLDLQTETADRKEAIDELEDHV